MVISNLVIGSREIIPERFEHVTHAQPCPKLYLKLEFDTEDQVLFEIITTIRKGITYRIVLGDQTIISNVNFELENILFVHIL